ncbi:hypothetical protein FHS96_001462 [Sphingomonas zeicaulis]|uniref:hypothetical protein n=1 Tax=Sphingomonas zeicaulis TaxID=1632740 RepID=UPI003D254E64
MMRMVLRTLGSASAALALAVSGTAQAAACITEPEMEALALHMVPAFLDKSMSVCATTLPIGAYLQTSGRALIRTYRDAAEPTWPLAKAAMAKIANGEGDAGVDFNAIDDNVMRQLVETGFAASLAEELKPQDCGKINRFAEAIAPLPTANMGKMVALLLEIGLAGDKTMRLPTCPAGQQ